MGYNASTVVDTLDYDFTAFVDDCKGTTPEPSTEKVRQYREAVTSIMGPIIAKAADNDENTARSADGNVTAAQVKAGFEFVRDSQDELFAILDAMGNATGTLCSNQPAAQDIKKLPYRVQQHFVGYMSGMFMSGEASTPVTTP